MRKAFVTSGIAAAILVAVTAAAQAQSDEIDYYVKRQAAAKEHCGNDQVLWLNTKTGAISRPGSSDYGTTDSGRYVCEHDQSQGRYGTEAEPTALTPGGTQSQPAPATPPK